MTLPSIFFPEATFINFCFQFHISHHTPTSGLTLSGVKYRRLAPLQTCSVVESLFFFFLVNWVFTKDLLSGPTKKDTLKNNVNIRFPSSNLYFMKEGGYTMLEKTNWQLLRIPVWWSLDKESGLKVGLAMSRDGSRALFLGSGCETPEMIKRLQSKSFCWGFEKSKLRVWYKTLNSRIQTRIELIMTRF